MRGPIRTPTEQEQSMSDLKGKVAIVTGASKGIGAAIAKNLAAAGAEVAVNYASSREGAERVVADIKVSGGKAIAVKGDVAKAADVRRLFEETRSAFGRVDVLVNNAGIYHFQPLEDITEDEFHLQLTPTCSALSLPPRKRPSISARTAAASSTSRPWPAS